MLPHLVSNLHCAFPCLRFTFPFSVSTEHYGVGDEIKGKPFKIELCVIEIARNQETCTQMLNKSLLLDK